MADYTYQPTTGRYRDAAGQLVPEATLRTALDALLRRGQAQAAVHAQRLADGTADVLAFRESMQTTIREVGTASALLAHGGRAAMDPSSRGWVGSQLRAQYGYLSTLALDWSQGRLSPAQLLSRAQLYPASGHALYEGMRRRDAPDRGQDEEANALGSGNPCDDCQAATALGWVPIGTLDAPGDRACVSNCRCTLQFRTARARARA